MFLINFVENRAYSGGFKGNGRQDEGFGTEEVDMAQSALVSLENRTLF